jgi:small-conductance mechanosensitive channel
MIPQSNLDLEALLRSLTSAQGMTQVAVLAGAAALAWVIARAVHARLPGNLQPGFVKLGAGSAHRLIFPLLFVAFAWIARFVLAKYQPVPLLKIAIPLIASYAVIRFAIYLLRHMMAPSALLKAAERFIAYTVWLLLALYLTGLMPEVVQALDEVFFMSGKDKITLTMVIGAVLSAVVTVFIALAISGLIEKRIMATDSIDMSSRVVTSKVLRALALAIGVLIALPLVGIPLTMLSVFGGALGVGLGFGLQKIASNYVSGFIILLDRSVRLGDLVTVDNRHGVIQSIRSRYTVIKGFDGTEAIIPNDTLITNTVVRHAFANQLVAVKADVTVAYTSDLDKACDLVKKLAIVHQRVAVEPAPSVLIKQLTDNGVLIELTVLIADPENGQGNLRSELLHAILRAFRENNIAIPLPQRDIHMSGDTLPPVHRNAKPIV